MKHALLLALLVWPAACAASADRSTIERSSAPIVSAPEVPETSPRAATASTDTDPHGHLRIHVVARETGKDVDVALAQWRDIDEERVVDRDGDEFPFMLHPVWNARTCEQGTVMFTSVNPRLPLGVHVRKDNRTPRRPSDKIALAPGEQCHLDSDLGASSK